MQVAKCFARQPGLVLDYSMVQQRLELHIPESDSTYYVPTNVTMGGTNTTFEGGTILKYASGAGLTVNTPMNWQGTPICL